MPDGTQPDERARLVDSLRAGRLKDLEFDDVYATTWRAISSRYWTPVDVARKAAEWLTEDGAQSVLDVGSGVGKLCIVGAATTDATFVGVEHRASLVLAARTAARVFGVEGRTMFVHAEASLPLMRGYRAIYLFNPFGENLYSGAAQIDARVPLGKDRYRRDVGLVEQVIGSMPAGGRLVTYHGFGGRIPDSFSLARDIPIGSDALKLWLQSEDEPRGYFVERDDRIVHLVD
ncbi:MAG: hypothetical protein IPM79_02860 [Polyangiaceae bacterium]|nr:hypothetical protein [Polyangiaceae bacterium]MBK8936604.1 hypothetical protein [Polyangiaceae bacterium]